MTVICTCAFNKLIAEDAIREIAGALESAGQAYIMVDDLCRMAASEKETLAALAGSAVIACHPRAVKAHFASAGCTPGQIFNLRTEPAGDVLRDMDLSPSGKDVPVELPLPDGEWAPWFPAIDRERCNACRKCMDYCLFGVYSWDGTDVRVANPASCKDNCPACARVCPQKAIIFPKYGKSPINGGLTDDEDVADLKWHAGGDLYSRLAARNRNTSRLTDD